MVENVDTNILNQPKGIGPKQNKRDWNMTVDDLILEQAIKEAERKMDEIKDKQPIKTPFYNKDLKDEYEKVWKPKECKGDYSSRAPRLW
jgi:hypothetical protein